VELEVATAPNGMPQVKAGNEPARLAPNRRSEGRDHRRLDVESQRGESGTESAARPSLAQKCMK